MRFGLITAILAMAGVFVFASSAQAITVTNPGPFNAEITQGFLKVGDTIENELSDLPENPTLAGTIDSQGNVVVPKESFNFGTLEFPVDEQVDIIGRVQGVIGIEVNPTSDVTGTLDPVTGASDLNIGLSIRAYRISGDSLLNVGNNCRIGTDSNPILLPMRTDTGPIATNTPGISIGGIPYDLNTGNARYANKTFTAPGQTGCSGLASGMINDMLGLPSGAGLNAAEFEFHYDPAPISNATINIASTPDALTNQTDADFTFTTDVPANPGSIDYECRIDAGTWEICNSLSKSYSGLADGSHTFEVRALAGGSTEAGTATPYTWEIDTVLPVFTVTGAPLGLTKQNSANLGFSVNKTMSSVSCQLDSETPETPCTSPVNLTNLSDGSHTWKVYGTDAVGNYGDTSKTWTVDATKPQVTIDSGPPVAPLASATVEVEFEFTATDNRTANPDTRCRVTDMPDPNDPNSPPATVVQNWTACSSPDLQVRENGFWKYEVRATDEAGNVSDIASHEWETDSNEPIIDSLVGPAGDSNHNTGGSTDPGGLFEFTSDTIGSTFECWLDDVSIGACTSPTDLSVGDYPQLASGQHKFEVRPTSPALIPGPRTPYVWAIDVDAPTLTIDVQPPANSKSSSAVIEYSANSTGSPVTVMCKLDLDDPAECDSRSSHEVTVADGPHTMKLQAFNGSGQESPVRTVNWVTDTVDPQALITEKPAAADRRADARFSFNTNDDRQARTATCELDGGSAVPCDSLAGQTYTGLADGNHSFKLTVRDAAGNTVSRSHSWLTDTIAPTLNISEGPANPTDSLQASFKFTQSDGGSGVHTVTCQIDGGARIPCDVDSSGYKHYPGPFLAGSHNFEVRVTDVAGNVTTKSYGWNRVSAQTDVAIATQLVQTRDTDASVEFVSDNDQATFECKLDAGSWAACTSPADYSDLSIGDHVFSVRAINQVGERGLEQSKGWTILAEEVVPPAECPDGQIGTPPDCEDPPVETCPDGQVGTPPNCKVQLPPISRPTPGAGTFDGKELGVRLLCYKRFRTGCQVMRAVAVTRKKGGQRMSSVAQTRARAGQWRLTTMNILPRFRDYVSAMTAVNVKTLRVKVLVRFKKRFRRRGRIRVKMVKRLVYPIYKVRAKG